MSDSEYEDSASIDMAVDSPAPSPVVPARKAAATRKKQRQPAKGRRNVAESMDPFDNNALFQPTDTMMDEMNAMKQVFLKMSKKKVEQKETRKSDCKRLYKEAFQADVEQLFAKANKRRSRIMDGAATQIDDMNKQLKDSTIQLRDTLAVYKEKFDAGTQHATNEIRKLKQLLEDIESKYSSENASIEKEFDHLEVRMEHWLQQLHGKLHDAHQDTSFVKAFRAQIERLAC